MSGQNSSKRFPARRPANAVAQRSVVAPGVVTLGGSHVFSMRVFATFAVYRPHAGAK
jgi:hypothetical protein